MKSFSSALSYLVDDHVGGVLDRTGEWFGCGFSKKRDK